MKFPHFIEVFLYTGTNPQMFVNLSLMEFIREFRDVEIKGLDPADPAVAPDSLSSSAGDAGGNLVQSNGEPQINVGYVLQFKRRLFDSNEFDGIIQLYVRKAYLDIAEIIFRNYYTRGMTLNDESMQKKALNALNIIGRRNEIQTDVTPLTIISGTPGIGKSASMALIAYICWAVDIPFSLIGHGKGSFDGMGSYGFADRAHRLFLLDHDNQRNYDFGGNVILFTSPNAKRLDDWSKHGAVARIDRYYMNVWSLEELTSLMGKCFKKRPVEWMKKLYDKFGGVPRFCLPLTEDKKKFEHDIKKVVNEHIKMKVTEITNTESLMKAIQAEPSEQQGRIPFSLIHHICPKGMDICQSIDLRFLPASAYVAKKLAFRAREQLKEGRLVAFLTTENDPKQAILRGRLYEPLGVDRLLSSWITKKHTCKYLGDRTPAPNTTLGPNHSLPEMGFQPYPFFGINELKEAVEHARPEELLLPGDITFPVADVLRRGAPVVHIDLFQFTVALKHPISYLGLQHISEQVRQAVPVAKKSNVKIRIFFCVPEGRLPRFAEQDVVFDDEPVECPPGVELTQFCMEVPAEELPAEDKTNSDTEQERGAAATEQRRGATATKRNERAASKRQRRK